MSWVALALAVAAAVVAARWYARRVDELGRRRDFPTGPEFGYVRWGPDGTPERWGLLKRDACRTLPPTSAPAGSGRAGRR